jgi:hypothetical protein
VKDKAANGLPDAEMAAALAQTNAASVETRAGVQGNFGLRENAIADYRAVLTLDAHQQLTVDGLRRLGVEPWRSVPVDSAYVAANA